MALDWETAFPGKMNPATPAYPFGEPKNVSGAGLTDGTPWNADVAKELWGPWLRAAELAGGITPSGTPESATVSQYLDALLSLLLTPSDLARNGGTVLETINRGVAGDRWGLDTLWLSNTIVGTNPGAARNQSDTIDLLNPVVLAKRFDAEWELGGGVGGVAPGVFPISNGWLRRFLVGRPADQVTDIVFDTSPTAANFFSSPAAIAEGFTDSSLYRRIAWDYGLAGGLHKKYIQLGINPIYNVWDVPDTDVDTTAVSNTQRLPFTVQCPPETLGRLSVYFDSIGNGSLLITEESQTDSVADDTRFTIRVAGGNNESTVDGLWRLNASSQLYARRGSNSVFAFKIATHGWVDEGIAA